MNEYTLSRVSFDDAIRLLKFAPLEELQLRAHQEKQRRYPDGRVTFILDSNPNYTNICDVDCTFCAFYRTSKAQDAYMLSIAEVGKHLEYARKAGLGTVLLQGGVHPGVTIDYLVSLIKLAKEQFPEIHPHFFSAVEIWNAAKISKITIREALEKLWDAGQRTLPGGGAEILSERVRKTISPKKIGPDGWIELHRTAHEVGFKTTATMMYGHIEREEEIIEHLELLRSTQDRANTMIKTNGMTINNMVTTSVPGSFSSFIPWSYKPTNTALRRRASRWAGAEAYYRLLAVSRLYLDNFPHIGASWFSEGKEIGIQSLCYGADDFGGTLHEENVHKATEHINCTDGNGMLRMIRQAGFKPMLRNSFYEVIRTFEDSEWMEIPVEGQVKEIESTLNTRHQQSSR